MTPERLAEIEGREKAATPGPWKYATNVGPTQAVIMEADGSTVLELRNRLRSSRFERDIAMIAAARTDIPALLAHTRALEAENGRLREALEPFAATYDYAMRWGDEVRHGVVANSVTLEDCAAARAALQPEPK